MQAEGGEKTFKKNVFFESHVKKHGGRKGEWTNPPTVQRLA